MRNFLYPLVGFLLVTHHSFSQSIENLNVKIEGEMILVSYELNNANPDQPYEIGLYSSVDNFGEPLKFVTGDVGQQVKGSSRFKSVKWNFVKELGNYQGNISVEVRGKPFLPFIRFANIAPQGKFKRGKTYDVNWTGGKNVFSLNFEVLKEDKVLYTQNEIPNKETYSWTIPKKAKPGKDYRIRISNSSKSTEYATSDMISIKRKFPLGYQVAVVVGVVSAGVYVYESTIVPEIPLPPNPGQN
jgi:hypothetical protein